MKGVPFDGAAGGVRVYFSFIYELKLKRSFLCIHFKDIKWTTRVHQTTCV